MGSCFIRRVISTAFVIISNFCERSDGPLRVCVALLAMGFMHGAGFLEDACSSKRFVFARVVRF